MSDLVLPGGGMARGAVIVGANLLEDEALASGVSVPLNAYVLGSPAALVPSATQRHILLGYSVTYTQFGGNGSAANLQIVITRRNAADSADTDVIHRVSTSIATGNFIPYSTGWLQMQHRGEPGEAINAKFTIGGTLDTGTFDVAVNALILIA